MSHLFVSTAKYDSSLASWIYLADWILILFLGVFFVFYFARLVGMLLSLLFRFLVWNRYKVLVSIDSFRISPLGGRVTARNVVVSTADHTVSMLRVNFTWKYWLLRMTRMAEYHLQPDGGVEEPAGLTMESNRKLPCLFELLLDGLEIFVYNRSATYDSIVETLRGNAELDSDDSVRFQHSFNDSFSTNSEKVSTDSSVKPTDKLSNSLGFLLRALPIEVRIGNGAMVIGNLTTPSVLVASFKSAVAIVDVCKAPARQDLYRTRFDMTMLKFQVSLKPNITHDPARYLGDAIAYGSKNEVPLRQPRRIRLRAALKRFVAPFKHAKHTNYDWNGLRRYVSVLDDRKIDDSPTTEEYAKYSLIVDSVVTQMIYYYDTPGVALTNLENCPNPEFGIDFYLSMATIHYGSWADRQRGALQAMLFPPVAKDSDLAAPLEAGQLRKYPGFNLRMFVKDEVIMRIPTREISKDKEVFQNQAEHQEDAQGVPKITRPFGWFEMKLGRNSKIAVYVSYLASEQGFQNTLSCRFFEPELRTSVNHDVLLLADEHHMECDLALPLKWNGECLWRVDNFLRNCKVFFLREHAYLLTDLISDWASGPPIPYEFFRPVEYAFLWKIENYGFYFNVNDHNIINNPLDFNANKYLRFSGDLLEVDATVPTKGDFAKSITIDYKITTQSLDVSLEVPPWHTVSSFMKDSKLMGSTSQFEVAGSYTFYNVVEVYYNNFAIVNAIGDEVTLLFHGYFIRYLFTLRENYFGEFKTFKTFEEYTDGTGGIIDENSLARSSDTADSDLNFQRLVKTENDLNVLFTFQVRDGLVVLPSQIYDHKYHIGLLFQNLDIDIHITHYYMDLQADFSPADGYSFEPGCVVEHDVFDHKAYRSLVKDRNPHTTIDGFSVHTHRMFGLHPDLLTYYCKWDFDCGRWTFENHPHIISSIALFVTNFAMGFKDLENTLIYDIPIIYDAANFCFRCPEIALNMAIGTGDSALEVIAEDVVISFNDIANLRYSDKIVVSIPNLTVGIKSDSVWHAYVSTSLTFTDIGQKAKMLDHRVNQQQHVRKSDALTHRAPFLLFPENKDSTYEEALGVLFPPTSILDASVPLTDELHELRTGMAGSNYSSVDDSRMMPTLDYDDEDFKPSSPPRPNYKHDSFIIELTATKAFVSPEGVKSFVKFGLEVAILDMEFMMDNLQKRVVKTLRLLINPISMVDNVRFVCPQLNLRVADSVRVVSELFDASPLVPHVDLSVKEVSLAMSTVTTRERDGFKLMVTKSTALAFHIAKVEVLVRGNNRSHPLDVLLSDIKGWTAESDSVAMQFAVGDCNLRLDTLHLDWLVTYFTDLLASFKDGIAASKPGNPDEWDQELLFALANATRDINVHHDPDVLTKPSSIVRSCEDHVRMYDSWKLLTKFRDILRTLPQDVFESENQRFNDYEWTRPRDALEQVFDTFAVWRSWECDRKQKMHFFKSIFESAKGIETRLVSAKLASLVIRIATGANELEVTRLRNMELGCGDTIIMNLESLDIDVNPQFIELVRKFASKKSALKGADESPSEVNILVRVAKIQMKYSFRLLAVVLTLKEQVLHAHKSSDLHAHYLSSSAQMSLLCETENVASLGVNGFKLSFTQREGFFGGARILRINLTTADKNGMLCRAIEDCIAEAALFTSQKKENSNSANFALPRCKLSVSIIQIVTHVDILHPLVVQGACAQTTIKVDVKNDDVFFESGYKVANVNVSVLKLLLFRMEHSQGSANAKLCLQTTPMLCGTINMGYFKLTSNSTLSSLDTLLKNLNATKSKVEHLSALFKTSKTPKMPGDSKIDRFAFKIDYTQEYFGISLFKDQSSFNVEYERVNLVVSNVTSEARGSARVSPLWGELVIPTLRMSVLDPQIRVGLSTILDFNCSVKVSNNHSDFAHTLQVESQHLRVCLSSSVVIRIIDFGNAVVGVLHRNEKNIKSKSETVEQQKEFKFPFRMSSAHLLFYGFCAGWIFEDPFKDYPGVILGAERLFAVTKSDMGKITLMEGYLSVAKGSTATSFFATLSEVNSLNRAYMPKMQLNYAVIDDEKVYSTLKGDELDVRFMSNSVVIVERALKSSSAIQDHIERRARDAERRVRFLSLVVEETHKEASSKLPFNPRFTFVESQITFAGSKVFLYRLNEEDGEAPSLSLQSPAVLIAVGYKFQEEAIRKMQLNVEVLMSLSDNTIYSLCVPVLMDFVEASKAMITPSSQESEKPAKKEAPEKSKEELEKPKSDGNEIGSILKDVDLHCGVVIENQRISLSCEPTAKVEAVIEHDGATISAKTDHGESNSFVIATKLNGISASLQHIYSDAKSGVLEVEGILFSTILYFKPSLDIVSSLGVNDVSGFVKMKQFHDVDLFRDVWYPKKYRTVSKPRKAETTRGSILKSTKASSVIPVSLTSVLTNFNVEVDFGPALGTAIMDVDKAWIQSRKTSDWYTDVNLGLQSMVVGCDGRLGGYLKLENPNVHMTVEWKLNDLLTLDIPLVMVNSMFRTMHFKVSFDSHVFALANVEDWSVEVFNRKNGINISKDHLFVIFKYEMLEVFVTSLAASNFYDIYSTIVRMIEDKQASYKENFEKMEGEVDTSRMLEVVKKLETKIEVAAGVTRVQVYPQGFDDAMALCVELDRSEANFLQNEYVLGVSNELELHFNDLKTSLSLTAGTDATQVQERSVEELVEYCRRAKGGLIFVFPKFLISMRTFQKYNVNLVEYLFQSSFGGTVDVRWNLGLVNIVREMYSLHKSALESRVEHTTKLKEEPVAATGSKYTYVPLAAPIIEAPRLKELGNATPPLEWFGLHRNKFPDATHQYAIVALQRVIHRIEREYSKTLRDTHPV